MYHYLSRFIDKVREGGSKKLSRTDIKVRMVSLGRRLSSVVLALESAA